MPILPDFSHRHRHRELLDCADWMPSFTGKDSKRPWWGSDVIFWPSIARLANQLGRPVRLLEVFCGTGELLERLAERAKKGRVALELHGCDPRAAQLNIARQRAADAALSIEFHESDCLAAAPPACFDATICSLVLHRFSDAQALRLLRHMAGASQRLVLAADLRRGLEGYLAAQFAARLLISPWTVWGEGPQSIESAFTPPELEELCRRAGMPGARIQSRWGGRMLLHWDRLQTCEALPKLALGWTGSG